MKLPDPFRILLCAAVCLSGLSTGIAQEGVPSVPGSIDAGAQVSGSYVISPLDYLRVALFVADEAIPQEFAPGPALEQRLAGWLGTVQVAGKSIEEMRDDLYAPYNRDYYVNPHIDVVVLGYSERSVTVIGKVNRQGLIPFPSEEGLTLLQAIALAGGWSADRLSDKRNVTITRTDEDGERFVIQVDARNITSSEYPLREGDLINVPERIW